MTKTNNLRSISRSFAKTVAVLFYAVGYFFGFSIVAMLSAGLFTSEEFDSLIRGRQQSSFSPIYKKHGQYFVQAAYVSMFGWMLLAMLFAIATK